MARMPKKSIWDSHFWKSVIAIGTILGIISSALQISGKVDFWNSLILPIVNFFMIPVPLYSIPLAFLVVLAIILGLAYASSGSATITNPFDRAEVLDNDSVRYLALLCRTLQTTESLRKNYWTFVNQGGGYKFEDGLKTLEERDLVIFQNGKWEITQKALDYIAKYHGDLR